MILIRCWDFFSVLLKLLQFFPYIRHTWVEDCKTEKLYSGTTEKLVELIFGAFFFPSDKEGEGVIEDVLGLSTMFGEFDFIMFYSEEYWVGSASFLFNRFCIQLGDSRLILNDWLCYREKCCRIARKSFGITRVSSLNSFRDWRMMIKDNRCVISIQLFIWLLRSI